jgi:Transposase DDE domain group 1
LRSVTEPDGSLRDQWLAAGKNLSALGDLSGQWIDRVLDRRPPRGVVLDMYSSVSQTHGEQENSVWNGHYECTSYHPLFVFNQFGEGMVRPVWLGARRGEALFGGGVLGEALAGALWREPGGLA